MINIPMHDSLEDRPVTVEQIEETFGKQGKKYC
jgi:(p)ppGpp synthase/HD superfamily hydrolase